MTTIPLFLTAQSSPSLWVSTEPTTVILMAGLAACSILVVSMVIFTAYRHRSSITTARPPRTISDELAAMRYEMLAMRDVVKLATTRLNSAETELEELRSELSKATQSVAIGTLASLGHSEDEPARIGLFSPTADSEVAEDDGYVDMTATPDDLTRIWGIGPGNQQRLQENGIYYFRQIAAWTDADVGRFNTLLSFKGRIEREGWISQAKMLIRDSADRAA